MNVLEELQDRVARYDAERYPVQHATARFHLGVSLTNCGRVDEALESLARAVKLFDPDRLPVEHAKALNALGAARRLAGDLAGAAVAFERAAPLFDSAGLEQEQGAALFNLGLVRRQTDPASAVDCFRQALELLAGEQEGAAARELGATLLELGELDDAVEALEQALELASQRDAIGYGGAANALGLACLARGETERASELFRDAAGAHPRSIRPAEFAMAKANLALAHERLGDLPRARLAARQALGVAGPPEPVVAQAEEVLARAGAGENDLLRVLAQEPSEHWEGIFREELARSSDAPEAERRADAASLIHGSSGELAHAWLAALLELPSESMELQIRATLGALAGCESERQEAFRSDVSRAAARFHVPQLLRLEETFGRLAAEIGVAWS